MVRRPYAGGTSHGHVRKRSHRALSSAVPLSSGRRRGRGRRAAIDHTARTSTGPGLRITTNPSSREGAGAQVCMLLSFERPGRDSPAATLLAVLENCRCEADVRAIDKRLVRQQQ